MAVLPLVTSVNLALHLCCNYNQYRNRVPGLSGQTRFKPPCITDRNRTRSRSAPTIICSIIHSTTICIHIIHTYIVCIVCKSVSCGSFWCVCAISVIPPSSVRELHGFAALELEGSCDRSRTSYWEPLPTSEAAPHILTPTCT